MTQKLVPLKKKITGHNHDKYITTPEVNTVAAGVFNAGLAQANLITKTDCNTKLSQVLTEKFPQINQNIYLLKMS